MFWSALIWWPQAGHAERGSTRLYRSAVAVAIAPSLAFNSAHSARQRASIIFGIRWMTTLRMLPMQRPISTQLTTRNAGELWSSESADIMRPRGAQASDDGTELEPPVSSNH